MVAAVETAGFGGEGRLVGDLHAGLDVFLASRGYSWLDLVRARAAVKVGRGHRPVLGCMRRLDGES